MQLDASTLVVSLCAIIVLVAVQCAYFWLRERQAVWLAWLSASVLLGGAGLGLYVPRAYIPELVSIGAANACLIGAAGLTWQAARRLERRLLLLWPVLLAMAVWLVLCLVPWFLETITIRTALLCALTTTFYGLTAAELWRGRSERLPSRMPAMGVVVAHAVFVLIRLALAGGLFPLGPAPNVLLVGASGFAAVVCISSFAMLMVSMTLERREAAERSSALTDQLTGLLNRRALFDVGHRTALNARDCGKQVCVVMFDLDRFKSINDRNGHALGDTVLMRFASAAGARLGRDDLLFRIGGEEFCLLMPDSPVDEAVAVTEAIRRDFAAQVFAGQVHATLSAGVASPLLQECDLDQLLRSADRAVYEAKRRGRNRVVVDADESLDHLHRAVA